MSMMPMVKTVPELDIALAAEAMKETNGTKEEKQETKEKKEETKEEERKEKEVTKELEEETKEEKREEKEETKPKPQEADLEKDAVQPHKGRLPRVGQSVADLFEVARILAAQYYFAGFSSGLLCQLFLWPSI